MTPDTAVLMAAYNAEKTLPQAVNSLLNGTHPCKIYIVDDASGVPVADVITAHDPAHVEIIRLARNGGPAAARNAGLARIREAGHRYVAIMDADDIAHPERLARQVAFLRAHPNVALVGCWECVIDEHGAFVSHVALPCDPQAIRDMLFVKMCVSHPTCLVRAEVFAELGGYATSYRAAEDYEFVRRVAARHDVANLPEYLLHYRLSSGGMSARNRNRQLIDRLRIQLAYFAWRKRAAWVGIARTLALLLIPVKRSKPDTISSSEAEKLQARTA
jgi:glycosyltransferase involved in cell wall biosynthesis